MKGGQRCRFDAGNDGGRRCAASGCEAHAGNCSGGKVGVRVDAELKRRGSALDVGRPVEHVECVGVGCANDEREVAVVFPAAIDGTTSAAGNFQEKPAGNEIKWQ